MNTQLTLFDYTMLSPETRIVVQQRTSEIKTLMRRTAQDIVDIGQKLIEVKGRLGHGQFGAWLECEFEWTTTTAWRFMNVAERFSNLENLDFASSALYLLAEPSTPDLARIEAVQRAEAGEPITYKLAQVIVASYKPAPQVTAFAPAQQTSEIEFVVEDERDIDPLTGEILNTGPISEPKPVAPIEPAKPSNAALFTSDSYEWYTPARIMNAVRQTLDAIDLDPASSAKANETVQAAEYFTAAQNGLTPSWCKPGGTPSRVFMNPPYGETIGEWVNKLCDEYESGWVAEAITLLPARTDTQWMRRMAKYPRCFVWGRLKFSGSDNSATFPSVVIYLGNRLEVFHEAFRNIGDIYMLWSPDGL